MKDGSANIFKQCAKNLRHVSETQRRRCNQEFDFGLFDAGNPVVFLQIIFKASFTPLRPVSPDVKCQLHYVTRTNKRRVVKKKKRRSFASTPPGGATVLFGCGSEEKKTWRNFFFLREGGGETVICGGSFFDDVPLLCNMSVAHNLGR